MELFARCDREPERLLAVTEEGKRYTLGDLNAAAERIAGAVGEHRLVFVLCENTPGTLLGYLGCLKAGEVPLLLDAHIAPELLRGLLETYRPAFVHVPGDLPAETGRVLEGFVPALEVEDSALLRRPGGQGPELHPELALLLTTSGSTGSPKLVRLSGRNLDANTRSIVEYLELDEGQRPVTNLAMSYSYGMSIVNTHLLAGAALVLTRRSVLERPFWELVERERVTSLAGVPYTYRMYRRAGLLEMELPALNTLTQAGGKLPEALHLEFADWAARTGRRFFVMYGQTEAAPRMGYLPAERAVEKCGSMGVPVRSQSWTLSPLCRDRPARASACCITAAARCRIRNTRSSTSPRATLPRCFPRSSSSIMRSAMRWRKPFCSRMESRSRTPLASTFHPSQSARSSWPCRSAANAGC